MEMFFQGKWIYFPKQWAVYLEHFQLIKIKVAGKFQKKTKKHFKRIVHLMQELKSFGKFETYFLNNKI